MLPLFPMIIPFKLINVATYKIRASISGLEQIYIYFSLYWDLVDDNYPISELSEQNYFHK